ncbi:MAG: TlyA family RNA methyltransferase [Firmicutes bacterium]|nr:TlyA family RNA methyltransferase [Bacillota bacterium]
MAGKKQRLDSLLVEKGFFDSRERAKRAIMAGLVLVDEKLIDKPGARIDDRSIIIVKGDPIPYVSRGGLKLEKAIRVFNIDVKDSIGIDVGASTGGFTHCLLEFGAKKVYAIDVGYGQLAWKLRKDPRVIPMERKNIRYLTLDDLDERCDIATIDVSFISLKKVIPSVLNLLAETGEIIALIKPQFETQKEKVGKKGVVKSATVHKEVIYSIIEFIEEQGLSFNNLTYSPIKGPEGNIEFLIHLSKIHHSPDSLNTFDKLSLISTVVNNAHEELL